MRLRILDHAIRQADITVGARLPQLPSLLTLSTRDGSLLRPILVPERTSAGSKDDIGVPEVLEESREAKCVHATRNDWGRLLHALPLLSEVRAIRLVILKHERDVFIGS